MFQLYSCHLSAKISNENKEEEDVKRSQFPHGFLFGTSTSSYQIEGGYLDDGKGLNNWDVFSHIPGNIENSDNGDVAHDHYHRFLEDIEIMNSLGVNAYRFSISWARILPRGRFGEVNPSGIREDFVHFAKTWFENFGERVKYRTTLNEPNLFTEMAYIRGRYPPARCSPPFGNCSVGNSDTEPLIVLHNMSLSHAKAVKLYRQSFQEKQGGCIGIVAAARMYEPLRNESELNQVAVRRKLAFKLAWMLDPLVYGDYPRQMHEFLGNNLQSFTEEETKYIKGSVDFIGTNHYSTLYAKDCLHSVCSCTQFLCSSGGDRAIEGITSTTGERNGIPIGEPTGMSGIFVVPKGMEKIINYIKERYDNIPIYVTENGYSSPRQKINEQLQHLLHDVERIKKGGADVRGYFAWSLTDNLEWTEGFSVRYGLYHVDRQTLQRIPKLSATWYKNFLKNDGD
ncbi:hypothetical protein QYF36_016118 [Acer negundo]|nr:hypothetical protein QYF36_016118 [Acer negundo]